MIIDNKFVDINSFLLNDRKPDFSNLLKVLKRQKPNRPTLFEFFLNDNLYSDLTSHINYDISDPDYLYKRLVDSYKIMGYDYINIIASDFHFPSNRHLDEKHASVSLNDGFVITDRDTFNKYKWPDPDKCDYSRLERIYKYMPEGMKIIVYGPNGVLETVIDLVGYENLCYLSIDEPELVQEIFDAVGSRFVRYYEICASYDCVGALISNDDWGFNTQTFLSTADMRKYVIPWHKKIVEKIHKSGKPAILHSCGKLDLLMDDIIDVIKYDAKYSFEDTILPVEEAYDRYSDRIAILGGIDVDYICRSSLKDIYNRANLMLERVSDKGGYALGSGNSIPYYVPNNNYFSLVAPAILK